MTVRATLVAGAVTFSAGTRLGDGGRYELRRRIGVGGMAEVYKAVDARLGGRVVAIKIFSVSAVSPYEAKLRALFVQEAQAISRVEDENVVDVLDFGVTASGSPYTVMELLHGVDLGELLRWERRLPVGEAVDIALAVCAGVQACHMAGIVHRDLKPANVFLCRTSKGLRPKVLDFSVAKILGQPTINEPEPTRTDLILGTPGYMSPEQALGHPATALSDQYAVGALLYRCTTGHPPRASNPNARIRRPELPAALEAAILRALDPEPGKRFETVHALGHSLLPFASPAGLNRWRSYYESSPAPFEPTITGSISGYASPNADRAEAPSRALTRRMGSYDFAGHERTTRLGGTPAPSTVDPTSIATSVDTTLVDPVVDVQQVTTDPEPTTVEVIGQPVTALDDKPPSDTWCMAKGERGRSDNGRSKVVALFGVAAAVVFLVTFGASRSRGASVVRARSSLPPALIVTAAAAPNVLTSSPSPAIPSTTPIISGPFPSPPPRAPFGETVRGPEAPEAHSPRRAPPRLREMITYGDDGIPIVH